MPQQQDQALVLDVFNCDRKEGNRILELSMENCGVL